MSFTELEVLMFKCDYHTHSYFSFDGDPSSSPEALCESAISHGVTDLAITDHFEANYLLDGDTPPYRADEAYDAIAAAKEKYKGRLNLTYGIELGQADQSPDEVKKLFDSHNFEFVIASIHNLRGEKDFYFFDFSDDEIVARIYELFESSIAELCEVIDMPYRIDSVAHLTYMHRYVAMAGKRHDFANHADSLEKLFKKMISNDIALEINVSTLCRGLGFAMPDSDILSVYRDCGGRLITVGSDSHSPALVGNCIDKGFELVKHIGLNEILVIRDGERAVIKI